MNKTKPTKKIVIIDDEPDIQYTIKEICLYGGWSPIIAQSGIQGYELCKVHSPNLVIIDYHMPDWDGLTTVKKIRQFDVVASILVLTVDERQEIAEKFIAAGATDFAIKPIKSPDLISRIKINLKINEVQQKYVKEKQQVFIEKGISPATLSIICDYLNEQREGLTIDEITSGLGLAYQTVHRYIQYLIEESRIEILPIYGQLGRPKNKYKYSRL
ncbi:two-component system response regulator DctR [Anaerosolibacter carboniphilus]|uniref:Stage 0 sporulation protein A homolog n=1 Tax=Anaerosolibacter carboniphilus TaxID=1417629 RepID=A0A841KLD4_9FIRM|nr:response regulator [Anaerosolibacter carboniphilus]MBB6214186.1 two-component system response regulator DctR [Anaerosolibacter carboniphilus]